MMFLVLPLYILLYFWSKGNITIRTGWKFHIHRSQKNKDSFGPRHSTISWLLLVFWPSSCLANHMIFTRRYPLAYWIQLLPLCIFRWYSFLRPSENIPVAVSFIVSAIFSLSGLFNVLLFFFTRRGLLLFGTSLHFDVKTQTD